MDIKNFETAYLNAGGKSSELEKEDGEYVSSKSQMGWQMWQVAKAQTVSEKSRCIYLNCNQLKQALNFGAPDLFSETKGLEGDLEFQLETEMSIEFIKDGHSGPGFYCWYSDLPEEGSILLTEELEMQEND